MREDHLWRHLLAPLSQHPRLQRPFQYVLMTGVGPRALSRNPGRRRDGRTRGRRQEDEGWWPRRRNLFGKVRAVRNPRSEIRVTADWSCIKNDSATTLVALNRLIGGRRRSGRGSLSTDHPQRV